MAAQRPPCNTWEQVGKDGVYISKHYSVGRDPYFCGWQVVSTSHNTGTDEPWYNNGNKTFNAGSYEPRQRGAGALEAAKAWAAEHYGIYRWKRNAVGDYVDADANLPPIVRD